MNQAHLDQSLTAVVRSAEAAGLKAFVMIIPTPHESDPRQYRITLRFNEINPALAINLTGFAFKDAIRLELERHPEYSPKYRAIYESLAKDFESLLVKHSAKLKKFK